MFYFPMSQHSADCAIFHDYNAFYIFSLQMCSQSILCFHKYFCSQTIYVFGNSYIFSNIILLEQIYICVTLCSFCDVNHVNNMYTNFVSHYHIFHLFNDIQISYIALSIIISCFPISFFLYIYSELIFICLCTFSTLQHTHILVVQDIIVCHFRKRRLNISKF